MTHDTAGQSDSALGGGQRQRAGSGRPAVATRLLNQYYEFDFFQAVRILQRLLPQTTIPGGDAPPSQECVRFRSLPSLTFPPSAIAGLTMPPPDEQSGAADGGSRRPGQMTIAFFGLTGPSGALPRYYTEMLIDRLRSKDRTLHEFLDLFHHRLTSLFLRAWGKYRHWARFEQAELIEWRQYDDAPERHKAFLSEVRPRIDPFSQNLLDIAGLGSPSLRYAASSPQRIVRRSALADDTFRYYAGLFGNDHRPASGLERLVREYFGISAEVCQCVGQWLSIELEDQSQLSGVGRAALGDSAVAGQRFRDWQSRFRIRLGPMDYEQYLRYLPSGAEHQALADLARLYARAEFDMEVQLVLRRDAVPPARLSGDPATGPRLGWNVWVGNQPPRTDRDDAVLAMASTAERLLA